MFKFREELGVNKEIVIVTKDGFKFEFKGEEANEIAADIHTFDESELIFFGSTLAVPRENLSYYWVKDIE